LKGKPTRYDKNTAASQASMCFDFPIVEEGLEPYGRGMPKIRILPDQVANQIAAGEVVERPVAVLKELVENSLDAGAKKIEIEFRNGGKSYLRVEDDGVGMKQDQALMALERHATSKIRLASDLNKVSTFGFRGEALPSIASVSRFVLRTRSGSSSEGSEIFINGGKMIHCKECGMPRGTRIEVSHLFNSVPGRRKFLKTEATESTHLVHMSKLYALAHPGVTFTLVEGGRTIFRSPACNSSLDRVREIFGRGLADSLASIDSNENDFHLTGLVGKPGESRPTRKEMIFFVNGRPVENRTLSYAVMEGFHGFVPKGRFPPAILFLQLDPMVVDVNVHPAKREVRFRDEAKVRSFVLGAILTRNRELAMPDLSIPQPKKEIQYESENGRMVPSIDPQALNMYGLKGTSPIDRGTVEDDQPEEAVADSLAGKNHPAVPDPKSSVVSGSGPSEIFEKKWVGAQKDPSAQWRLLGRPFPDLVIFSTPHGVVALHLRASYERVRLEQLENGLRETSAPDTQSLLLPEPLECDGIDRKNLQASLEKLRSLGFKLEEFGRNFYRLEACPVWIDPGQAKSFLMDFLSIAKEHGGGAHMEAFAREALQRQVNYSHENREGFTEEEILSLVSQLLECRNPYVCPKGRPTYFEIPKRDFETRFKRKL